jgi:predicted sulfurtransferase
MKSEDAREGPRAFIEKRNPCIKDVSFDRDTREVPARMPLKLKKTVKDLLAEANAQVETIQAKDSLKLKDDPNVVFVDIRDIRELDRDGRIAGAFHAPRGMLEFWIDPESPYYKDIFGSGKKFLFF